MSTYASKQDVENYIEGWVTDDAFALERLIQRAEQDLDSLIVPIHIELPPTQVVSVLNATGGSFTLTLAGNTTGSLAYNSSAAALQAALQGLPGIGSDTDAVSNARVLGANPWTVVWTEKWVQTNYASQTPPAISWNVPLITVGTSGLTGAGATASVVAVRGRKVNPLTDLNENQVLALSRATCAQVEYRNAMGEAFFVRPQHNSVRGPDFTTQGRLPMLGPKVRRELAQTGLVHTAGRASAGYGRRGVGRGWPTY